ncbi:hypothetical protein GE300_14135 [Rhodobacteraceae bacterium 2CG4]|uniref:Uncharacterized protein n=1 Tax=Halovulum marinum TaxID=2662447 RepID=A0A6L5Z2D4_9RHOB|nr:hypothetical protein [Halovulum marinum]MSU90741.1 hypothetical protein [Halovulum marinum]
MTALDVELAQSIFPIARSDRRKHSDLFRKFIAEHRLKDDKVFYDALLQIMASGDYAPLRSYDSRMTRSKHRSKTFGFRALRWLHNQSNGELVIERILDLPEDHFPFGTAEREVHMLYLGLLETETSAESASTAEEAPADAPPAWTELAHELAEGAQKLDRPEVDAAERLVALAEALAEACRAAAEAEMVREKIAARAANLRDRLVALGLDLSDAWLKDPDTERLDNIDAALSALERARQAASAAEDVFAAADREVRAAAEAQDYMRLQDLSPHAAEAKCQLRAAGAAEDKAVSALAALLRQDGTDGGSEDIGTEPTPATIGAGTQDAGMEAATGSESEVATAGYEPDVPVQQATDPDGDEASADGCEPEIREEMASEPEEDSLRNSIGDGHDDRSAPDPAIFREAGSAQDVSPKATPLSPDGSPDPGDADPEALLAQHIAAGDIAFAWHLARLRQMPVPAPILRALAILSAVQQAEDMADPRRSSALAELAAALQEAADPVAAARLAMAALLRPALFDPDHGARGLLGNLLGQAGLEAQAPLIEALGNLGYDVRLSAGLLAELAGARPPFAEPAMRERVAGWLAEARHRKTGHQPTYAIFHRELHSEGEIGCVVEAAIAGSANAEALASELINRLSHDRGAQEAFVSQAERSSGRPRRDRIEGMALDWFCRGIQEACDQLSDWLEAKRQDARQTQDHSREPLLRELGLLRKALDASVGEPPQGGGRLAEAAYLALAAKLDDLRALVDGRAEVSVAPRLRDLLEAPLLRLPGGCQDWTEEGDPAFDVERAARDTSLAAALLRPACIARDDAAAFDARISERATLAAHSLLERQKRSGSDAGQRVAREQQLGEAIDAARQQARERVARLRQSLTTIGYLDLDAATALPADLSRLAIIETALVAPVGGDAPALPAMNSFRLPDLPPDFPELDAVLAEMEDRRDQLQAQISRRQQLELERLTASPHGQSARALLAAFDRLDPVTADDAIAEIKAGREVPMPEAQAPDVFSRFFPDFVAKIAASPEETKRGRILTALETRGAAGPLDLECIDERRARRLKQLLEAWAQGENSLRQSQPPRLRETLAKVFELIGFSGIRIAEGREALPARLRLLTMQCDVPRRADGFLPSTFGSAPRGRYHLLAARADVSTDQLLRQIGSEAPDAPWIVVLFGRLDVKERYRLARQMRAEARTAVVLEETLLLFAGLESDDPFATFFDCAMPFAWQQPYTISPGQIPPEIFFGREAEIDKIVSRNAEGCLIYGGRQLGKSVLLNHVRGERNRPERGELALYLDIRSVGGPGVPPEGVWQSLAHELRATGAFHQLEPEARKLLATIEAWLDSDPARRLLVMFDEADNFLRAEHAAGYPHLLPLKGLMERTERRFKVVFAGLHNVRRMAHAPNSPLPHLGEPICIGPMNQSPANRAALRRLAVEPMRSAGLDYSDPGLASDMLARMNYYPSLVQVFGRQIVESFGRRPRAGDDGPRWKLDRESLFEGAAAERIADQIRDRFQLTLNLDVRYDCIARSIALHPALLVTDLPPELAIQVDPLSLSWRTGLRRGDRVIWAEEHLPATREGLAADLAVAIAVELCGWRLDLAAALVQAGLEDLAAPVAWLSRRAEAPIAGLEPPCPLAVLADNGCNDLHQRLWKAQLAALFPEIENRRLGIVSTHRSRLRLDDHLRCLGVASIEEIELGALRYQLRRYLNRTESERLDALARARNALAHRQPLNREDILLLLRN